MVWWIWILLGFVLLGLELLTTGVHLGLFGVAAIAVGVLVAAGIGGPLWFQFLLFSILSVVLLLVFRKPLLRKLRGDDSARHVDSLVGEVAIASAPIAALGIGRAELRGTSWTARNGDDVPLVAGQRCRVDAVEGLMLVLRAEGR